MKMKLDYDMLLAIENAYNNGLQVEWYNGGSDILRYCLTQCLFKILRRESYDYKPIVSFNVKEIYTITLKDVKKLVIKCENITIIFEAEDDEDE